MFAPVRSLFIVCKWSRLVVIFLPLFFLLFTECCSPGDRIDNDDNVSETLGVDAIDRRCDVDSKCCCRARRSALVSGGVTTFSSLISSRPRLGGDRGFHFRRFRRGERVVDTVSIDAVDQFICFLFANFCLFASASVGSSRFSSLESLVLLSTGLPLSLLRPSSGLTASSTN